MISSEASAFITRFGATADQVSGGTGISREALLIQWAVETGIGAQVYGNNPGNIECGPGVFCHFATLSDFALAAINVWKQTAFINNKYPNGFNPFRAACVGQPLYTQLRQIGASPWDAGNYGLVECGYDGCSLVTMWRKDFGGDKVDFFPRKASTGEIAWDSAAGKRVLHPSEWSHLLAGGAQSTDLSDADYDSIPNVTTPTATIDFTPVLDAIAAVKSDVDAIKAKTDKDLA